MTKNIWFILGVPGARVDFVTGWISNTFSNFVKYHWLIDFTNGKSWLISSVAKKLDKKENNPGFTSILNEYEETFKYSSNSTLIFPMHGYYIENFLKEEHFKKYNFKFIKIIATDEYSRSSMAWEDSIKNNYSDNSQNYLFNHSNHHDRFVQEFNNYYKIINTQEQIIDRSLQHIQNHGYQIYTLDYDKIVSEQGSYYIIDKLGLVDVRIEDHDFYKRCLMQSHPPNFVIINQQKFTKEEFLKTYQLHSQLKEKLNVN